MFYKPVSAVLFSTGPLRVTPACKLLPCVRFAVSNRIVCVSKPKYAWTETLLQSPLREIDYLTGSMGTHYF